MIQRFLKIKDFRNIGAKGYERLNLNVTGSQEDKMGGLVTLIGMNNTGKSNFLETLYKLKSKKIKKSDRPSFKYGSNINTGLVMSLVEVDDRKKSKIEYQYKLEQDKISIDKYVDDKLIEKKNNGEKSLKSNLNNKFEYLLKDFKNTSVYNNITSNNYNHNENSIDMIRLMYSGDAENYKSSIQRIIDNEADYVDYEGLLEVLYAVQDIRTEVGENDDISRKELEDFSKEIKKIRNDGDGKEIIDEVKEKYILDLVPNIIKYDDKESFREIDMMSTVNEEGIANPDFFKTLFSILDENQFSELENAYKMYFEAPTSIHAIRNYKMKINKELEQLAKRFNKVYGQANEMHYGFNLDLESDKVFFTLTENNSAVRFDDQSTGFKWFFNFFFNVFANTNLKNGDIVILDEPATNLHVSGQVELRKQIRQFGFDHGITFVLSTHSPFLIHLDYLDEVRLVSKDNLHSKINNKFSVSDKKMIDVLMPIQSSLTVDRHIISDPDKTLVYVEGITDYNYLVAFKRYLKYNNLTFLPVQGVKNTNKVFNKLNECCSSPVLLVDSDFYGKRAQKESHKNFHNGVEVRTIDEVHSKYQCIEDLFTEEDRSIYIPEKSYDRSVYFKNYFDTFMHKLSKNTMANFKALLENLSI